MTPYPSYRILRMVVGAYWKKGSDPASAAAAAGNIVLEKLAQAGISVVRRTGKFGPVGKSGLLWLSRILLVSQQQLSQVQKDNLVRQVLEPLLSSWDGRLVAGLFDAADQPPTRRERQFRAAPVLRAVLEQLNDEQAAALMVEMYAAVRGALFPHLAPCPLTVSRNGKSTRHVTHFDRTHAFDPLGSPPQEEDVFYNSSEHAFELSDEMRGLLRGVMADRGRVAAVLGKQQLTRHDSATSVHGNLAASFFPKEPAHGGGAMSHHPRPAAPGPPLLPLSCPRLRASAAPCRMLAPAAATLRLARTGKATLAIQQYLVPAVMTNVFVGAAVAGVYSSSKMAEQLQWLGNRVIETAVGEQLKAMPFSLLQAKQVIRDVIGPLLKDQGKMAMAVALLDAQGIESYTRAGGYHAVSLARLVVPLLNILSDEQINAMADAYIKDLMQKMLSSTTTHSTAEYAQALKHMLGIAGRQRNNNNIPTFA
ncbi:hypothetical protein OEZ85_010973 [Tetradesmus obliquus]|uniref:Uncharacterized protein n=1 Tax=Tetradesmus obliquus TaxID=3088 RepID=A0ABY8TPA4_TETOB|nr:hypothetical protein OEZ85_010973 [Tetradesmus obliquus]